MKTTSRKAFISRIKRVVIKIGSSVLTDEEGEIQDSAFYEVASGISKLKSKKIETVVVSSGAIASGMKKLGLKKKATDVSMKQAIAACGQSTLMWNYERAFSEFGERVAQILLTHDGLTDRRRFLNARKTLLTLLRIGIIPIINENDTVAVEEIMFGDNDNLAALVTSLIGADLLILLTNIDGLYTNDPRNHRDAEFLSVINEIDMEIQKMAGETFGKTTTGGMKTKIEAAKAAAAFGVPTIIANGKKQSALENIFSGEMIGTLFIPSNERIRGRKHWIAFTLKPSGDLIIDDGAKRAIASLGKSLLPSGITGVKGNFELGESVRCIDENGSEIARGLASYGSDEIRKILGAKSTSIEGILGYKYGDEIIHRDDLVVILKEKSELI
jgi:glutamate 5-kinase